MSVRNIWEHGIWLGDAPYYFAPTTLRVKYDEPENALPPPSGGADIEPAPAELAEQDLPQLLQSVTRRLHELGGKYVWRSQVSQQMNERLLQSLQSGKLIAYGFPVPRNSDTRPVPIPPDLFERRNIDSWKNSTIRGAALEFVSVRVFRPNWLKKLDFRPLQLPKPQPAESQQRPPGRPSSKDAVTAAIRSLIAGGQLLNGKSRKENIAVVRARVHELFPSRFPKDRGLAEETIGKYLMQELPRP
ncbi:MAG TPA: hypothetical protein VHX61_01315 [Rhizomicrobium sp.]|nr:hypothetical protein [Rhizomicrobium sp.]